MSGKALTPGDLSGLAKSGITPELAERAGLYRVNSADGAALVGRIGARGDFAGIVFPYRWPGNPGARANRLRRDHPDMETYKGRPRERGKYMAAPGDANKLYFDPTITPAQLTSTSLPLVITEGEKKALALAVLASHGVASPRFCSVGLPGVWNWKGTDGKTNGPNGERIDTKGPIPDLDRIEFHGRTVSILFDANVATNSSVTAARTQLALELTGRGAKVMIIDLPFSEGVNGIDDYLGLQGPEIALRLFDEARPFDPKEQLSKLNHTDYGNEQAFAMLFGNEFLYCCTTKEWLQYDGVKMWRRDKLNVIDRRMLDVARERREAAALLPEIDSNGEPLRKKALAAALKLQNIRVRQSAIDSARSNPRFARQAEDFDRNDYLFGCLNGVVDLWTGIFRPGRREDMLTKASGVQFDETAQCERWLQFLSEIFEGNAELIEFMQRSVGYSMLGLTREEVFFILHGTGRNGKGVFLRVLIALLGDYGFSTDISTLIADKGTSKRPRNDIAAMAGRRFVCAQESREGAHLDEALIKSLTGGDIITARFLHREFFTFRPTWKIWLATNHRPEIRGSDVGIWSRPKLIPFGVNFEGREDRNLKDALLQPAELSGILNWAIEGCRMYLKDGLRYPEAVTSATRQYRADSDVIGRFIEEECVSGFGSVWANELYKSFSKWASDVGEPAMSEKAFSLRMKERGMGKHRLSKGMKYMTIALRAQSGSGDFEDAA